MCLSTQVVWTGGSFGCLLSWSLGTFGRGALGEASMELGNLKLWLRLVATCSPLSANLGLIDGVGCREWARDVGRWWAVRLWKLVNGLIVTRASIGCDGSDSRWQVYTSLRKSQRILNVSIHLCPLNRGVSSDFYRPWWSRIWSIHTNPNTLSLPDGQPLLIIVEESLILWLPRNAEEIALLKSLKLHKEDASCQWIGEFHPKTLRWSI